MPKYSEQAKLEKVLCKNCPPSMACESPDDFLNSMDRCARVRIEAMTRRMKAMAIALYEYMRRDDVNPNLANKLNMRKYLKARGVSLTTLAKDVKNSMEG